MSWFNVPVMVTAITVFAATPSPSTINTSQVGAQQVFSIFLPIIIKQDILVDNPGNNHNIQPALQEAINRAQKGDTVVLPAGEFYVDGTVVINKFVSIKGQGTGPNGTILYRREDVSDATLDQWSVMLNFRCFSTASSNIVVSGIYFKSKVSSEAPGDGKSQAEDYGIYLKQCVDFLIERNKFEHFGTAAVRVAHKDSLARGVIAENVFIHNWRYQSPTTSDRDFTTLGYGVAIGGEDKTWVSNPQFGSDNFIFIEDNYFFSHRHSVMGHGAGLYVFRYNEVRDNFRQAIDAHGGGNYGNTYSTRAYEVYKNRVINTIFINSEHRIIPVPTENPCSYLVDRGLRFRGGEGLVYSNTIQGFISGIGLNVEVSGTYPVFTQIGYQDGDLYSWDNIFLPQDPLGCAIKSVVNTSSNLLQEDRDYHLNTVKPGYTAYTYPHPLRSLLGSFTLAGASIPTELTPVPIVTSTP